MEAQLINNLDTSPGQLRIIPSREISEIGKSISLSNDKCFIQANTIEVSYEELRNEHIIPVFIKDNEPLISHSDFIATTMEMVQQYYKGEVILKPTIRVSHPIKGRIPEAKNKAAIELLEHEKTLYYERMMFCIEVPTIKDEVGGNMLSLTIGGVKSFSEDNLYNASGADQHFKIFIGFKNTICTNLCLWTDGCKGDLRINNLNHLQIAIRSLIENFNAPYQIDGLRRLSEYTITEKQFAQLIGRCRMYQHLPKTIQAEIPPLMFGDNQLSAVCKDYYRDESFSKDADGNINLWKLYNLFTGVNKASYIDTFVDKSVNAYKFTEQIRWALEQKSECWFLN